MLNKSLTFDKSKRVLTTPEYSHVFNHPIKKIHSPHFLLFVAPSLIQSSQPRLGLAITKKKQKKACDRNYIKRVARQHFRVRQHELPSLDSVLIVKQSIFDKAVIYQELESIFDKLSKMPK